MAESLPPVPRPALVAELRPVEANSHVALTFLKWHRLILAFGLVLMLATALAMQLKPTVPSATARILVKTGPDALPITGLTAGPARTLGPELLQTEAELLGSRIVLLPVARALRAQRGETVAGGELDSDVAELRSELVVTPVPNTTVIQATKTGSSEAEAERHLGMIIESYVEQHATAYSGSTNLSTFFERESGAAAANLADAEDKLRRWQEAHNIVAADEQFLAQLAAVGEFDAEMRRADVEAEAARAQIDALTRDIAALPVESVTSREKAANPLVARLKTDIATEEASLRDVERSPVIQRIRMDIAAAEVAARDTGTSPLVAKLKGDLATAELAVNDLRQRYHDEDRRVQEKLEQVTRLQAGIAAAEREAAAAANERAGNLRRELVTAQGDAENATREKIEGLRAQLVAAEREGDYVAKATVAPNPLRENLNRDLVTARTRVRTLTAQRDGLRDQIQAARTNLAYLRDKRVESGRVVRQVELAKALYVQNTKRLDDARLTTGLRKHQLTNIAVIEPPRVSGAGLKLKHVAVVSLFGAIVGLGLGMATALALEFFNWSLRTPEDVEFYLGVPTLAAIPAVAGAIRPPSALPAGDGPEREADRA